MTTFKYINGVPKNMLTDNMRAVVDIDGIYHNKQLIATHEITNKIINYTQEHYLEGLKLTMPYKEDSKIEEYTKENLKKLDALLVTK